MGRFDQSVCELIKKKNVQQHSKRSREEQLSQLQAQLQAMREEKETILGTSEGNSEAASQLRQLENRLDKMMVKYNEASHIRKTYEMILEKLQAVY